MKKRRRNEEDNGETSNNSSPSEAGDGASDNDSSTSSSTSYAGGSILHSAQSGAVLLNDNVDDSDDDGPLQFSVPETSRLSIKPRTAAPPTTPQAQAGTVRSTIPVSAPPPPAADFSTLGVSSVLVASLGAMSIRKPTPVQRACIPQLLSGELRCANGGIDASYLSYHRQRLRRQRQNW